MIRAVYIAPYIPLTSRTTPTVMTDFDKIFERRLRRHGVFSSCCKLWHVLFWKNECLEVRSEGLLFWKILCLEVRFGGQVYCFGNINVLRLDLKQVRSIVLEK